MQHRNNWLDRRNQRKFFDEVAKKLSVVNPQDWGKITKRKLFKFGGSTILQRYYNGSLKSALQTLNWFENVRENPYGFWKNEKNQRDFLDDLQKKFNIKNPREWGKITLQNIIDNGGSGLLNHYSGSLFKALEKIYPDILWESEWFININGIWKSKRNQRIFFEHLQKKLEIKYPMEWGKVPTKKLKENGAIALLRDYHEGSLFKALNSIFSEQKWEETWFNSKFTPQYWKSDSNSRNFLDGIAVDYGLMNVIDWKKVSVSLIKKKGGQGLLRRFNYSLSTALQSLYPNMAWNTQQTPKSMSNPHSSLKKYVGNLL